ncbi:carbohydrate ABC transporter permease [Anaerocolumna jejuensis]|uniref:carbohydrate ABC transporter permease n=1 Tax=Anaerocolumna jejuensis TaxID=259063 RepID=UPI003F7B9EBB
MNYRKKQGRKAFLFLAPSLIGVSVFVLIPFMDVFRRSFYEAMGGKFVGLANYNLVLHNEAFLLAAKNTARFLGICIPLLLTISLLFTVILSSLKKNSEYFKTTFLIPMAIPIASVVLLWKVFFHKSGLINVLVVALSGKAIDFMNTDKAFYVLVFSYIWKNTGYDMVLWLAGLSGIPSSLYEAAKMDGAGAFARLRYITLPELLPTVYITAVLSMVNSFKVFREAYLIAGDYPHESIYMLQHIFNNWFIALDIQKMCAAAVMMAALILLFIILLQRIDRKW